jgi:hypothetical protein
MSSSNNTSIEKLSVAECKKILCKNGKVYSDNEIISVRDLLYCLAQIDIDTHYHMEKKVKEETSSKLENIHSIKKPSSLKKGNKALRNAA